MNPTLQEVLSAKPRLYLRKGCWHCDGEVKFRRFFITRRNRFVSSAPSVRLALLSWQMAALGIRGVINEAIPT
jgi:hypothetical protein